MDYSMIEQIISSLGFPIVMCIALFWYINKQEERRREELDGMRETISENTQILSSLKDLIQIVMDKLEK